MHRWFLGGVLALALLITGCGGGDDEDDSASKRDRTDQRDDSDDSRDNSTDSSPSSTDQPEGNEADAGDSGDTTEPGGGTRDEYMAAIESVAGEGAITQETNCLYGAYIDAVGVDRLNEVTSPEEIAESGLPAPADLGIELTDAEGDAFYNAMSQCIDVRQVFLGSMGDPAITDCLNQKIDDAALKTYVLSFFVGTGDTADPAIAAMEDAMTECQGLAPPPPG